MKVSCLQEQLSHALGVVARAVPTRTTLPITGNILVATDKPSRLRLSATNLEVSLTRWIDAKVEEEGAIAIPARLLVEFVSNLPSDRVALSVSPRSKALQLECGRFQARISGMDAEDFPPTPQVVPGVAASFDPKGLQLALRQVIFAAATEDSRPVLTGVYMEMEKDSFTLAAADGFRLAVHEGTLPKAVFEKATAIVPARALAELNRLLGEQEEEVEMVLNPQKGQVLFRLKNLEMVAQLIQGTFPNFRQLIPERSNTRAEVSLGEFVRATKMASVFAKDGSGIVRLQLFPSGEVTPGKIVVSARAEELGENTGELDAVVEGEEAKIAFNNKYLSDVLGVIDKEQVSLEVNTPSSPGVLRPVGAQNYVHVIMPMFVQW